MAVVDFTYLQGNVTELGRFLAEELSVALAVSDKAIDVVDRTHLKALLQEHKLAASGVIDPATARRLGEIAGVQTLITGTITPFGAGQLDPSEGAISVMERLHPEYLLTGQVRITFRGHPDEADLITCEVMCSLQLLDRANTAVRSTSSLMPDPGFSRSEAFESAMERTSRRLRTEVFENLPNNVYTGEHR